eukprot:Seg1257.1 transcript_id=Seg1257.1/GoldUCD/mRNA.D3Y31 product="Protein vav" protein_id=Seg1257.1/GoldUCD/D3Y31
MANPEWQMAKEWLRSTGAIPAGSKIHTECDLIDFVQALRDGVILCEIANHIRRGAVRDYTRTTHMSGFFCIKNISGFLKACETIFHIPQRDLFSPRDLYDVSDFEKVIHCLSLLSKSPLATQMGLFPFPPEDHFEQQPRFHEDDDKDDIYSLLEVAVADNNSAEHDDEDIYDVVTIAESEKIYDDIVKCSKEGQAILAKVDKRSHVVNEIIQTEENYVNALRVMIQSFIGPLKTSLKTHDREAIFLNTEKLYEIHGRFSSSLKPPGMPLNLQSFIDYSKEFLEYAYYCTRMQDAQQQVTELCKDHKFSQLVEECQRKSGRKFPLHEQLIVPFQRILKYPLLLRGLLKDTPPGHPERAVTEKALEIMEDIAKYINIYKKDDDMRKKIAKIEASVKDDLCQSDRMHEYGRFINDGEVQVKFTSDESKKAMSKRYAFLFDKCLLLCKTRGEAYDIKEKLDLKKFKVDSEITSSGKGKFTHCWNLSAHKVDGVTERNNCTMFVTSRMLKETWVSKLEMCIVAVQLSRIPASSIGRHKFELTSFSSTTYCKVCDKLLCGLISQGYRCEGCQFNVHYDCIEKCPECLQSVRKQRPGDQRYENKDNKNIPHNLPQRAPTVAKEQVRNCVWFAGVMNRHTASEKLQDQPDGTFLVRESDNAKGSFVLSVIYQGEDKHIKIVYNDQCLYSLTETVQFKTIPELIEYYKRNTLGVNFPSLPTILTGSIPGRDVVIARYGYNARNQQELSLRRDARVAVLKREGDWWFGELDGNFGFFPKNYVEEVSTAS